MLSGYPALFAIRISGPFTIRISGPFRYPNIRPIHYPDIRPFSLSGYPALFAIRISGSFLYPDYRLAYLVSGYSAGISGIQCIPNKYRDLGTENVIIHNYFFLLYFTLIEQGREMGAQYESLIYIYVITSLPTYEPSSLARLV